MDILTPEELETQRLTQSHRKRMLEVLTTTGYPSNDPDMLKIILSVMKDMDKNTMDFAKLRLAKGDQEADKANAEVIAEILRTIKHDRVDPEASYGERNDVPALPDAPEIVAEILPGELELPKPMGTAEMDYDLDAVED